ncbi:hypothetical protein O9929_15660 [Vibrio lentus]|nr:hypothetical protein [Vibrio lentus]
MKEAARAGEQGRGFAVVAGKFVLWHNVLKSLLWKLKASLALYNQTCKPRSM